MAQSDNDKTFWGSVSYDMKHLRFDKPGDEFFRIFRASVRDKSICTSGDDSSTTVTSIILRPGLKMSDQRQFHFFPCPACIIDATDSANGVVGLLMSLPS